MKYLGLFLLFLNTNIYSQDTFQVTGVVKDERNEPIIGAQVFISRSQKFGLTNERGEFSLSQLNSGNYELVINYLGFYPESKKVVIDNQSIQTNILLKQKSIELNEVVVHPDPNKKKYYEIFKKEFLGSSINAANCKILNPEILKIFFNNESGVLEASSDDYLIIENRALGYQLKYLLTKFELNRSDNFVYYEGFVSFDELKGSAPQEKKWIHNRQIAYNGSLMHYMRSLYDFTSEKEGFISNSFVKVSNPNRPSDSLIKSNIKTLQDAIKNKEKAGKSLNDTLIKWERMSKIPENIEINVTPVKMDSLITTIDNYSKSINFGDYLRITYSKEKAPLEYWKTKVNINPKSRFNSSLEYYLNSIPGQSSSITLLKSTIIIDKQGRILNPGSFKIEDYWSWEKVAEMLPDDYISKSQLVKN